MPAVLNNMTILVVLCAGLSTMPVLAAILFSPLPNWKVMSLRLP